MNTEAEARKLAAESREQDRHLQENMRERAEAEIKGQLHEATEAEARELIAEERKHAKHLEENMRERAKEEIN